MTIVLKSWMARLSLIFFGLFLLLLLEGVLRLAWTPPENQRETIALTSIDPFVVENDYYVTKRSYLGAMRDERMTRIKGENTMRIFCFGGSSTLGYPYPNEKSWPKLLQTRLQGLYPERRFEIVNLGGNSYGSTRILALIRGTLKYNPDLIIVSPGHNEFVEDSFRATVKRLETGYLAPIQGLYLVKMLARVMPAPKPKLGIVDVSSPGQTADFLFSPSLQGTVYEADAKRRQLVLNRLEDNLTAMTETARAAGVPLMMATAPSNLLSWPPDPDRRVPPYADSRADWDTKLRKLERVRPQTSPPVLVDAYSDLVAIWPGNATIAFGLGQALLEAGQRVEARKWLLSARDLDPAPVRASQAVLNVIRRVSSQEKLPMIDFEEAFTSAADFGLPGEELILDHVHPTPQGHLLSARTVADALIQYGILQASRLSLQEMERIEKEELQNIKEEIALDSDIAYVYGNIFSRQGRLQKAEEMFGRAGKTHPYARLALGSVVALQGRNTEAFDILKELSISRSDLVEIYPLLAIVALKLGNKEEALLACRKGFALGSKDYRLLDLGISMLLDKREGRDVARWSDAALDTFPSDCSFSSSKGRSLELLGDLSAAKEYYETTLRNDPSCHSSWEDLGLVQMNMGDFHSAATTFERAIASPGEVLPNHYLNLGLIYWNNLGLKEKGLAAYKRYIALWPDGWRNLPAEVQADLAVRGNK